MLLEAKSSAPKFDFFQLVRIVKKQLKMKILIKNGIIILKSVLKERCTYKKAHLLKQSIFV